jgi:hypothetical protein
MPRLGSSRPGCRTAGYLYRHEKEGDDWRIQESRQRLRAEKQTDHG